MQIGGYTFAEIGVTGASLSQAATGEDTLTLDLATPIDATDTFTPYAPYTFDSGDGYQQTFWLDLRAAAANPGETRQLQFVSGFRFLDLANYKQHRPVLPIGQDPTTIAMQAVMLGQSVQINTGDEFVEIDKIDARVQLGLLVEQLLARFGPPAVPGLTWSGTNTMPEMDLPWIPRLNATIGTCILSLLAWFPHLAIRSAGTGLILIDTSEATAHSISETTAAIRSITISPRHDLLVSKTSLAYTRPSETAEYTPKGLTLTAVEIDEATTANGSPRWIERTIELDAGEPLPATGLAQIYQDWVGQLILDTQLTLAALHWEMLPSDRLDLSGAIATPAGSAASPVIQTISRDLFTGTCQIQAGPRRHLSLDQLLELNLKPQQAGGGGGGGGEEPDEPETGTITRTIQDPQSGSVPGAYFQAGGQTASSGNSITLPPGDYTISYWVPPDYEPPANQDITLAADQTSTSTVTATFRARLRLRRADGQEGEDIDINVADIPSDEGTAKLRELDVCQNGEPKKRMFLCTDAYDD